MKNKKKLFAVLFGALVATAAVNEGIGPRPLFADVLTDIVNFNFLLMQLLPEPVLDPLADPPGKFHVVKPQEFDPARTNLVQAAWLPGIGCPTKGFTTSTGSDRIIFEDPGCPTGDPNDSVNEGLLLVKTGPTTNVASAVAELINVKGITLTELGYDIRKTPASASAGSHCGAGAPRFNVVTSDGVTHFIGCNSPPGVLEAASNAWIRLRCGALELAASFPPILPTDTVRRIVIVFDEGQDTGPDFFGAAILDNITVNGMIVGRGATDAS